MSLPPAPSARTVGLALLTLVLPLSAVACGSSSSASSGTTTAASTTTGSASNASSTFAKYTSCLRQNGVTLPNFGRRGTNGAPPNGTPPTGTNPDGTNRPRLSTAQRQKFQKAQTACSKYLPAGARNGRGFFGGGGNGQNSQAFAAYRNGLKLHGVTFSAGSRPQTQSAKVQKAMAACASLRPAGFGRGRFGPPPTGSGSGSSGSGSSTS
jgi:hypothetical protein